MQIRQKTLQLEKEDDPKFKYVRCRKKHSLFFGKGVRVLQNWMSICFAILVQIVSYGQQIDQSQGENRLTYMINLSLSWSFNRKSVYFLIFAIYFRNNKHGRVFVVLI